MAHREWFPVTRNLVYFNHAALGPLSTRAYDAVESHARDQREFGALHWRDWYAETDRLREAAARLIGAREPREIAIIKNTSEGLSFVAKGMKWREGDNVVTTALEFPSNWVPWKRLESRGVECRLVPAEDGTFSPADIEASIDERTRVVSVSAVLFHNGFACDLNAIGEICKRRNVLFCVDAIQAVGVLPIDVVKANISFLAADGHKWMCAPEGAGLFYVAAEAREELEPLEDGWTNIDRKGKFIGAPMDWLPDARRFEAGTLNTSGIYGLRAALELLLEIGIDNVAASALRVAETLARALESIGFRAPLLGSPIVGATPPDVEKTSILYLHRKLEENGIVTAPREGLLRFSPHHYNDLGEVEKIVETLRSVMR